MNFFKAAVIFLMSLIMVQLSSLPAEAFGSGSGGNVFYNRAATVYPLMNGDTYNNENFQSKYVKANNDSIYNIAPAFKKDSSSKGASYMPEYMTFGTYFTHQDNDNTYRVFYNYDFEKALEPAAQKGDLSVSFAASLTNDKHRNRRHTGDIVIDYPYTSLDATYNEYVTPRSKDLISFETSKYNYDYTTNVGKNIMGKYQFEPIGALPGKDIGLNFYAVGSDTCGSSEVSNIGIMLADLTGPKVTSIEITRLKQDGTMQSFSSFKAGDSLYINLKFNENIRFANDQNIALTDAPKLKFKVKRITDNVEETGINAEASLVSLDSDTLTFKYVVPETYSVDGETVQANHYIYEIEPYQNQASWVSSSKDFNLQLWGKDGMPLGLDHKSTSRIVDLAGNPIETGSSAVTPDSPAYMDNVSPTVQKVEIVRNFPDSGTEASRSDVFTSLDEKLGFYVYFSKPVFFLDNKADAYLPGNTNLDNLLDLNWWIPSGGVKADLNIAKNGTPVTAVATYGDHVRDGTNGPVVSRLYFELEEPISADMAPITYQNSKPLPIGINRIYLELDSFFKENYSLSLADFRGNNYDETTQLVNAPDGARLMPQQQLWLDVVEPAASTTVSGSVYVGYEPFGYGGGNRSEFSFPVTVFDQDEHGEDYISGTNGVTGSFTWRDNTDSETEYAYEYAVTGSADRPDDADYKSGITGERNSFTQIGSGNYIHIRLLDGVNYNIGASELVIYPVDYSGNEGEVVFPLDYKMDRVGPEFKRDYYERLYSSSSSTGSIEVDISALDLNAITSIEYRWIDQSVETVSGTVYSQPSEPVWQAVYDYTSESTAVYEKYKFTVSLEDLEVYKIHNYKLELRGTDLLGNTAASSFDFEYDLNLPKANLEFVTDPEDPLAKHSLKIWLPKDSSSTVKGLDSDGNPVEWAAYDYVFLLAQIPYRDGPPLENYSILVRFLSNDPDYAGSANYIAGKDNALDVFDLQFANNSTSPEEANGWLNAFIDEGYSEEPYSAWGRLIIPQYSGDYLTFYRRNYVSDWNKRHLFKTYEPAKLIIITYSRPTWAENIVDIVWDSQLHSKNTYTYNFANASNVPTFNFHDINITPKTEGFEDYAAVPEKAYSELPDQPGVVHSLDGAVFNVSLSNHKIPEYGIKDIDFDSADTNLAVYSQLAPGFPLYQTDLIPKASQDVTISNPNLWGGSEKYKVKVSVKNKNSDYVNIKETADFIVDRRKTDTYGVKQVKTQSSIDGGQIALPEQAVDYNISPGSRISELSLSADPEVVQSLLFEAQMSAQELGSDYYAAYIKVWNETAGIPADKYKWIPLDGTASNDNVQRWYETQLLNAATASDIDDALSSSTPAVASVIPIVPGENIFKYRIATTSGYQTPEQTLIVRAGDEQPNIEMQLSPTKNAGPTDGDVTASIKDLSSTLVSPDTLQVGMAFPPGAGYDESLKDDFKQNRQVILTENGDYYFYVYDQYHNYGYQKVTVDYIDRESPSLEVTNLSELEKNTFNFDAELSDVFDTEDCKLYIGFDDAYSNVLGVDPGTVFEVPTSGEWTPSEVSQNGIFKVSTTFDAGGAKVVSVSGAFRYDSNLDIGDVERTIKLYAVDGAGNKSVEYSATLTTKNEPAKFISGALVGGRFSAAFNKPILLTKPEESGAAPIYSRTKANLPFYASGSYPVEYRDIFGDAYEGSIKVDYGDRYNCTVSFSETALTNQDVQVVINTAFNPDISLELPANIQGAEKIVPEYNGAGEVIGASITMSQNGTFSYKLVPRDSNFAAQTRKLVIDNIDKDLPEVEISWVYSDDVVGGLTDGEIIASLKSDETLVPLENTGTTHTFTLYDQEPYTFNYSDSAGNSGSITADPPAEIVGKTRVETDETPPDYEMAVYQSVDGVSTEVDGYLKEEYEALIDKSNAFPAFSGILQLSFEIYDANQTQLSIKEAPVPGVSLRGNTVTVSENAQFTVVITDAANNLTEVPISITKADTTPPTGKISYVKSGSYTIRGYLTMEDNSSGEVTLKNTGGVQIDTEGEYQGQYYHEFLDNESFTFIFADAAGNSGSVVASVTSLDVTAPEGTITQWAPNFVEDNGTEHKDVLADTATNSDVSVYIQFNKAIREVTPVIVDGKGSLADISVSWNEDSATVVFEQNAEVKLIYTALNGRSAGKVLAVDIIDKDPPVIEAKKTASDRKTVTYTFTSDEEVFFENGGDISAIGTSLTKVFELNGIYEFKFTDRAGNSTMKLLQVWDVDRYAPRVDIEGLPATKESVDAYNLANGTALEHKLTNQPVTVKASINNEEGFISFQGVSHPVAANQQVELTVEHNGTYEIVATDLAGMTTRYSFKVDCIDSTRPQVLLTSGTIPVWQGTSVEDFEAKALDKVQVSDNYDTSPAVTISSGLSEEQLNTPGTYAGEFTAADSAGNTRTADFFVRVYDKETLKVRINGEFALPGETLFVGAGGSKEINVVIDNLPAGLGGVEPYKMYYKAGIKTPGQMKNAAKITDSFTAVQDGFYTVYIVSQSRNDFITYIYVQQ